MESYRECIWCKVKKISNDQELIQSDLTSCMKSDCKQIKIRAVAGQHTSPESGFANKTKMFFSEQKIKEEKSLDYDT